MNAPEFPEADFNGHKNAMLVCRRQVQEEPTPYRRFRLAISVNRILRIFNSEMLLFGVNEEHGYNRIIPGQVIQLVEQMYEYGNTLNERIRLKDRWINFLYGIIAVLTVLLAAAAWSIFVSGHSQCQKFGENTVGIVPWKGSRGDVWPVMISCPNPPGIKELIKKFPVRFFKYDRLSQNYTEMITGDKDSIRRAGILRGQETKIVIHGFLSNGFDGPNVPIRKAYQEVNPNINVIHVCWKELANIRNYKIPCYTLSATLTKFVGRRIQQFVSFLLHEKIVHWEDIHFLGHSLGSHCASFACKYLAIEEGNVCPKITAMDPAGPYFRNRKPWERIDVSDAMLVEVLHTSTTDLDTISLGVLHNFNLGLEEPLGHLDFYFNTGGSQPGCELFKSLVSNLFCSHTRAYEYYSESIIFKEDIFQKIFLGRLCESVEHAKLGNCSSEKYRRLGDYSHVPWKREILFVSTAGKAPYGMDSASEQGFPV